MSHLKTPPPHPATAVKNRGAKSRAGFKAAPQFDSNANTRPTTTKPITKGIMPFGGSMFRLSIIANAINTKRPVAKI